MKGPNTKSALRQLAKDNGRITWKFSTLEKLLTVIESTLSDCTADYGIRTKINWKQSDGSPAAELHTKRKNSLDLILYVPSGSIAIGAIAEFGIEQAITPHRNGADAVKIRFDGISQVSSGFKQWLISATE